MQATFKTWRRSREMFLDYIRKYTPKQLNKIPEGFNNNLIWHIGHVIVAQQSLVYKASGLEADIPERLVELYKPGTVPDGQATADEIHELESLLMSLVDTTIADFEAGKFEKYQERTTRTGFHIGSVEDALEVVNYHDGLHMGYMMSIRKFV